jgi:hypothetical protein
LTSQGERSLKGAEWELFREGLDLSWGWVEESINEPDLFEFGVRAFDELQPSQRVAMLAFVGTALNDETVPHPVLTAHNEATIAAVFNNLLTQVAMEIDAASEGEASEGPTAIRKLVLAAYKEAAEQDSAETSITCEDTETTHSIPTAPTVDDKDDDDPVWIAPDVDCDDLGAWEDLLDCLANRILWDDGDYEMGADFMDEDPRESRVKMEFMGIEEDYYTAIAPDPTEKELATMREQLRRLCHRPKPRNDLS